MTNAYPMENNNSRNFPQMIILLSNDFVTYSCIGLDTSYLRRVCVLFFQDSSIFIHCLRSREARSRGQF